MKTIFQLAFVRLEDAHWAWVERCLFDTYAINVVPLSLRRTYRVYFSWQINHLQKQVFSFSSAASLY